tara:strand:- start:521 stop:1165 length:645 start_codon:yes stop_codon:yes gene_type:complete
MEQLLTRSQIWKTLSQIDVTEFCTETEISDDVTIRYLPLMKAHEIMMDAFPEYSWEFSEDPQGREVHYFDDGSAEVRCRMTIGTHTNITYLPVHYLGDAVMAPNSMQIHVAKQRARVKALGEFGLGYKMWMVPPAPRMHEDVVAETVKEVEVADIVSQVEALWLTTKITEANNKSAGMKIYRRYLSGLENRGWDDHDEHRWENLCKAKSWSANK